ncbi:hypothetical protein B0H16DRAFT_461756 [Mycena metata]|uniref:Uncharacterized protein n=1 Tax=Mycena metata TaxID=1033252 RepID=A0AAD7DWS5_9AGAR|nr:hypothetical protein B0H16DRAFT_753668 [Mycena metata]KAJ7716157.1 hypothetical protein B0H16DRAFT_461756 [Mycena metata]
MEQDSYPAFYGEPSLAVPSPSHMFQNANDFTITGSRFMNVQGNMNIQPIHTGVRDVVLSLLEQERQGGRVVSGVPGNTLSPPAVYSASTNYCHQLVRQGRGFPMYVPSPQQNLPAEYRRTGIAIGDVGRVTPEGGFDFFFNIYRSASDPINANHVPQDFVPLSPYDPFDLTHYDFDCGEYVSTPSVYDINGGFSEPTPGEEFVFKCRGPDGAVLALPHGAHLEKLENLERMRQYAGKHAESWYRYVNEPGGRGRGLVNGSLCLITGCEKSKSWGMASFQNVSVDKEFPLSFRPTADEDNGYRYRWNGARCRHKQADPPLVDGTPLNQTTFIHAFTISLREGLWGKLFGDVEVAQLVDSFASPDKSGGGFVPFGSQGSPFSWSLNFFGFNSNNGGNQSRTLAQGNTIISDAWPLPQIFHPSRMIHERILREVPGANVVITHDDDWRDIFKDVCILHSIPIYMRLNSLRITCR